MSLQESARLIDTLGHLKVPVSRLLINNVVPEEAASQCDFCHKRRRAQQSVIREYKRRFGNRLNLFIAPEQPQEVRGAKLLRAHFADWHSLQERTQTKSD